MQAQQAVAKVGSFGAREDAHPNVEELVSNCGEKMSGGPSVPCVCRSNCDQPGDLGDLGFSRFSGYIILSKKHPELNGVLVRRENHL